MIITFRRISYESFACNAEYKKSDRCESQINDALSDYSTEWRIKNEKTSNKFIKLACQIFMGKLFYD